MNEGECQVAVIEHPKGISQGCKICGQVLFHGTFLIGIQICEKGEIIKYFLGLPSIEHCGEQKTILASFENEEEAEAERERVLAQISEQKSTEGLPLVGFSLPLLN